MTFRLAFLNCYNLFPIEMQVQRNNVPHDLAGLTDKIASLCRTLCSTFPEYVPDMIALSEVGSEALGRRIARSLDAKRYELIWSGTPPSGQAPTGLVILYNPSLFEPVDMTFRTSPAAVTERFKWMAVQFRLRQGSMATFWLVVNHWKSLYMDWNPVVAQPSSITSSVSEAKQIESAEEIGQLYLEQEHHSTRTMILVGDFNCEPGDKAFQNKVSHNFVGARERAVVLRKGNSKAYFYNPMWRCMGEPHDHFTASQSGYQRPLTGTWVGADNQSVGARLFDQLLVSQGLLSGQHLQFIEASLVIAPPETNFTDHCAIGAQFECVS